MCHRLHRAGPEPGLAGRDPQACPLAEYRTSTAPGLATASCRTPSPVPHRRRNEREQPHQRYAGSAGPLADDRRAAGCAGPWTGAVGGCANHLPLTIGSMLRGACTAMSGSRRARVRLVLAVAIAFIQRGSAIDDRNSSCPRGTDHGVRNSTPSPVDTEIIGIHVAVVRGDEVAAPSRPLSALLPRSGFSARDRSYPLSQASRRKVRRSTPPLHATQRSGVARPRGGRGAVSPGTGSATRASNQQRVRPV